MMDSKPPPPHVSPTGMWASKLTLRIIQFSLAIGLIGCAASITSFGFVSIASLFVIIPQACVSVIWSVSEAICILARGGHRGIHPGANVALDLLLWLGLIVGTVAIFLVNLVDDRSGYYSDGYYYPSRKVSSSLARSVEAREQTLIGLGAVLVILHFVTFVIACVETNRRNRSPPQIVFVQGHTSVYVPPGQGYAQQYQQGQVYAPPEQVYRPAGTKV